jgi:hypothetical protein
VSIAVAGAILYTVDYYYPSFFHYPNLSFIPDWRHISNFGGLFLYGFVMAMISTVGIEKTGRDEATLALGMVTSVLAGVLEELGFRWIFIGIAMIALASSNWVMGYAGGYVGAVFVLIGLILIPFWLEAFRQRRSVDRVNKKQELFYKRLGMRPEKRIYKSDSERRAEEKFLSEFFGNRPDFSRLGRPLLIASLSLMASGGFSIWLAWVLHVADPVLWTYQRIFLTVTNFVTFGNFEHILYNAAYPQLFVFGALMANAMFRDGHKYQGPIGVLNSWIIGFIMMSAAFTYGIGTAMFLHVIYDLEFDVVRYGARKFFRR